METNQNKQKSENQNEGQNKSQKINQNYQKLQQQLKHQKEEGKKVINGIQLILDKVKYTLNQVQITHDKINQFQSNFKKTFDHMTQRTAFSLIPPTFKYSSPQRKLNNIRYKHLAQISSSQQVCQLLKVKKNILFLTGPGLSAVSGIPAFLNKEDMFNKKNGRVEEILTSKKYSKDRKTVWQWIYKFKEVLKQKKANLGHEAIFKLVKKLQAQKKQAYVITQNIDNLHIDVIPFEQRKQIEEIPFLYSKIFQIQGNIKYVCCQNQQCVNYYRLIENTNTSINDPELKCQKCQQFLRPYINFLDQKFNQHFRRQTIKNKLEKADCLIVVGACVNIGMANYLVMNAVSRELDIIEISPQRDIEIGKTKNVLGEVDKILQRINELMN